MLIGYFADGPWSHKAFERLIKKPNLEFSFICGRFDQNDKVLKDYASKHKIPFMTSENINGSEFLGIPEVDECDIFVSMSFDQIFHKKTFSKPPLGTINCHAGKLPFYRGRSVLNWVLINDEPEFGITVHYVDDGIDTGDIIKQKCFAITDDDNYCTLLERASHGCAEMLEEVLPAFLSKEVDRIPQRSIHPHGFYCTRRGEGDEAMDWNMTSRQVFNFVRGICPPGPSARCLLNEKQVMINRVRLIPEAPCYTGFPGAVLAKEKEGLLVKTSDSYVLLTEWVSEQKIRVGDRFK
jgi:methionyl-tRNA formyltransferase